MMDFKAQSVYDCVTMLWPRHRFTERQAETLCATKFERDDLAILCRGLNQQYIDEPDSTAPDWKSLVRWLIAEREKSKTQGDQGDAIRKRIRSSPHYKSSAILREIVAATVGGTCSLENAENWCDALQRSKAYTLYRGDFASPWPPTGDALDAAVRAVIDKARAKWMDDRDIDVLDRKTTAMREAFPKRLADLKELSRRVENLHPFGMSTEREKGKLQEEINGDAFAGHVHADLFGDERGEAPF